MIEETMLLTKTGYEELSGLCVGTKLRNKDGGINTIKEIIKTKFGRLLKINDSLIVSPLHPILMCDGETMAIGEFRMDSGYSSYTIGFGMITSYGKVLLIDSIEVLEFKEAIEVYTLTTTGDGTYFANGICVGSYVPVIHPEFEKYNGIPFSNISEVE